MSAQLCATPLPQRATAIPSSSTCSRLSWRMRNSRLYRQSRHPWQQQPQHRRCDVAAASSSSSRNGPSQSSMLDTLVFEHDEAQQITRGDGMLGAPSQATVCGAFRKLQKGVWSNSHHATPGVAPLASLTRIFLIGAQPSQMFRNLASRRLPSSAGPVSLLVFLLALLAGFFAAVRIMLVKRVKACQACRGFGILRCELCEGSGKVDWKAKFGHFEICPLCMSQRYVVCPDCGGHYHRPMFRHIKRRPLQQDFGSEQQGVVMMGGSGGSNSSQRGVSSAMTRD